MELASKERIECKKQNESGDRKSNTNGVVITVYTESVTTRSRRLSISQDPTKKGTHGYDRRALLLAHSRELRNIAASEKVPLPTNQTPPKTKTKVPICSRSFSTQMPLPSSSTCGNERVASKESKETNPNASMFLSKMKNTLKQLSCKDI